MFGLFEILEDYSYGVSDKLVRFYRAASFGVAAYMMKVGTVEITSLGSAKEGLAIMAIGAVAGRAALSFHSVCKDNAMTDSLEHLLADEI